MKGGNAEKEAASLLFVDYVKGSTPKGSVKHLYVTIYVQVTSW